MREDKADKETEEILKEPQDLLVISPNQRKEEKIC